MGFYLLAAAVLCTVFRCNGVADIIFDLMLEQFTWFEFFACAVPLMVAWYVWLFLMYREKGSRSFGGVNAAGASGISRDLDAGLGAGFLGDADLMGRSKGLEGQSNVMASDVVFAGDVDANIGAVDDMSGSDLIADVIAELKEVFAILAREDGSKADFFRLMVAVKESYPGLGSHPGLASLNAFVSEHAPFLLTVAELEALWD